jgi:hypothetical protein
MSSIKFNFRKTVLIISVFSLIMASCTKSKEVNPDYVGSWASEQAIMSGTAVLQIKDIYTFTKDGFTELGQVFDETASKYIDYIKLMGSMNVTDAIMNVHVTDIGISTFDVITGGPTGTIVTYKEGSSQYNSILSQTGQSASYSFQYSVSGNSLTIYSDNNGDGDYADANETTVYTRQ